MLDVLIVGAGPVGLTMALSAAKQGLCYRIIDRLPEPSGLSKALALWSSALEMLDSLGVSGQILGSGVTAKGVRISRGSHLLAEIPAGYHVDSPFPHMVLLPQSETERVLRDGLTKAGGSIERGVELIALEQDDEKVTATVRLSNGHTEKIACRWLAGCDGAHSTVRHLAGGAFEGDSLEDTFILCDAKIDGDLEAATAHLFWSGDGLLAIFPVVRGVWRVIATREPGHDPGEPTLSEIQAILDHRGPGGLLLHGETWLSAFRISERKAAAFRHGRVFLAGDAAHVHSPAGGQGMNTGMQDAFNLTWKLAVLRREGANPLIADTYHDERSPVAAQVLRNSGRMIRSNMVRHRFAQLLRDNLVQLASHSEFVKRKMAHALSGIGIRYAKNPLVADDKHWSEDWIGYGYAPGTRPREVTVFRLREPVSLFREWGAPLFTLLLFSGRNPGERDIDRLHSVALVADGWSDWIRVLKIWKGDRPPGDDWLVDPQGEAHKRFGADLSSFYLIRPDQYTALRSQPAEPGVLQDWLAGVLGR